VKIKGPINTPWEGATFLLDVYFRETFNDVPPAIFFLTVPFHPNIDINTGKPCLSILDEESQWKPDIKVIYV
jgi:ubiquitin-protein ligase